MTGDAGATARRDLPLRRNSRIPAYRAALLVAAILVQALTFSTLLNEWNERSPDRFRKLAAEIPRDATLAAVPDFWYFFQSRNQPLRLIDYGFPEDREFWEARRTDFAFRLSFYHTAALDS